jgi:phage tail protein X
MIARVYGRCNQERLERVRRANPGIVDLDHLPVQTEIAFPRLNDQLVRPTPNTFRIQLLPPSSFTEAYGVTVDYGLDLPRIRLLPLWIPNTELTFVVLLEKEFPSLIAAEAEINQLPAAFRAKAAAIGEWPAGALFL